MFLPISRDAYLPCTQVDPEVFFPEPPGSLDAPPTNKDRATYKEQVNSALAVCNTCEFTTECLKYALENRLQGIWGATTDEDRKRIKHQLNLQKRREKQKSAP
jgi:WhiB family redox-sensing transcriptional regulator